MAAVSREAAVKDATRHRRSRREASLDSGKRGAILYEQGKSIFPLLKVRRSYDLCINMIGALEAIL